MIENFLRAHDGVITRKQALECGLSAKAVRRLVERGSWARHSRDVFVATDRPFTARARVRCAVWGAGPRAVAAGAAAVFWHGVTDIEPEFVDVIVPRSGRSRATGCRLRRRDLHSKDVVERDGLLVTSLELSVLDSGRADFMDRALQRHTTLDRLERAHVRNCGRTGAPAAARLLRAARCGPRSETERVFVSLLRAEKLTGWVVNYRFGGFEIDVAFVAERLAIELDGWAYHHSPAAFQRDRSRQNVLTAHWRVLRYTWADVTERPELVMAEVIDALARIRCSR